MRKKASTFRGSAEDIEKFSNKQDQQDLDEVANARRFTEDLNPAAKRKKEEQAVAAGAAAGAGAVPAAKVKPSPKRKGGGKGKKGKQFQQWGHDNYNGYDYGHDRDWKGQGWKGKHSDWGEDQPAQAAALSEVKKGAKKKDG